MHTALSRILMCSLVTAVGLPVSADVAEPLLRNLPPGVFVESSVKVNASQTRAIGQKLGGQIRSLTNSKIRIHGKPIQINVIVAADQTSAKAIHAVIKRIHAEPFCIRNGMTIVEYVGQNLDAAVAIKASYELGIIKKPKQATYQLEVELATIQNADYMSCNPLFVEFLKLKSDNSTAGKIKELTRKFTFSQNLELRRPSRTGKNFSYRFEPEPSAISETSDNIYFSFSTLKERHGVPYVSGNFTIKIDDSGFCQSPNQPRDKLIAPTEFWPADDQQLVALAKEITAGKKSNDEKVQAILEWLTPGKNIKYAGQTGSRWGTKKVFTQKFGHCWDFSDCFITLSRAAGVPSRQVAGWLYGSSGHVWAEYYSDQRGWQQVDPTGGGKLKCGLYHIPYFTSEDGNMPIVYLSMPKIKMLDEE